MHQVGKQNYILPRCTVNNTLNNKFSVFKKQENLPNVHTSPSSASQSSRNLQSVFLKPIICIISSDTSGSCKWLTRIRVQCAYARPMALLTSSSQLLGKNPLLKSFRHYIGHPLNKYNNNAQLCNSPGLQASAKG